MAVILAAAVLVVQGVFSSGQRRTHPVALATYLTRRQNSLVRRQWDLRAIGLGPGNPVWASRLAPVTVAIVDSGIDLDHPDLIHRLWHNPAPVPAPLGQGTVPRGAVGWDLAGKNSRPEDAGGHGTVVAGVIGAQVGNGIGIDGVAPNARLMALRACTRRPMGSLDCNGATYASALDWAASHGARVVNMSWSLGGGRRIASVVASHPGTLFVTNAENSHGANVDAAGVKHNCEIPYPNLVCVAGSNRRGGLTNCSGYGPVSVDIAAPGSEVSTTINRGRYLVNSPCAVTYAEPHVSGVAALLFGAVPRASAVAVRQALLDGARRAPGLARVTVSGGIVDAPRALMVLRARYRLRRP